MALLLIVLFIAVPIVEIYVIIQVGELIGVWPTIALLLADALLGSWILRHQGRTAWRRFNQALGERRFPGKEVADGALILVGGTLLLAPGFVTDVFGAILVVPPTRALVRRLLRRFALARFTIVSVGGFGAGAAGRGYGANRGYDPGGASRPYDFDGSAEEMPPEGERRLPG